MTHPKKYYRELSTINKHIIPYMHVDKQKAISNLPNIGFYEGQNNIFLERPVNTREISRNSCKNFKMYGKEHPACTKLKFNRRLPED